MLLAGCGGPNIYYRNSADYPSKTERIYTIQKLDISTRTRDFGGSELEVEVIPKTKKAYEITRDKYAVDPLSCPHRGGGMRRMARIDDPPVIEQFLKHLHLRDPRPPGTAPPADDPGWPHCSQIPIAYDPLPASA